MTQVAMAERRIKSPPTASKARAAPRWYQLPPNPTSHAPAMPSATPTKAITTPEIRGIDGEEGVFMKLSR